MGSCTTPHALNPLPSTIPSLPTPLPQAHSPLVPGDCWAFAGQHGQLVIALSHQIKLSHVTLGHISKSVSPTGTISSAPKEFSIFVSPAAQS